jgi:predicted ATPase/DNA-binding SARP family transcriptional activator
MAWELRILGPLEVVVDGAVVRAGGHRPRALLAALALAGGAPLTRDRLIDEVWGEAPPASAAHAVEVYVSRLRDVLEDGAIVTGAGPVYALAGAREQVDAWRFPALVEEARALLPADPEGGAAGLAAALALWRGALLADVALEGDARTEAARLEELRLVATVDRFEAELALGRHREIVHELEAFVAREPLRERPRGQLMLALYRMGRQAEALGVYRAGRDQLVAELGLEPGGELRALERAILNQDPSLDLPGRRPAGLPAPATALIGRGREVAEVAVLLRGDARLVTLTGAGGSGKTRLALAVAERVGPSFADGAWFVDLSALADPELVPEAVAARVEAPDAAALERHLAAREVLLVLDNFEQVDEAAPAISRWLAAAPGLRVLVTSRGRLDLYGEHEYAVAPLAQDDAVALFAARARARRRDVALDRGMVAEIARRLDGLPLAIELVAARVADVEPARMLDGLPALDLASGGPRDAPARHRALRAAIDWSHDLLPAPDRERFARLGVFVGSFDEEAARVVAAAQPVDLTALSARGLLRRRDGDRHAMLVTIRERALERLEDSDAGGTVRERHAEHFLAIAEASEDALKGPDQRAWGARIEADHDNLRAALEWSLTHAPGRALRMAAGLGWFWYTHGHAAEGARWLERALAACASDSPPLLRGRATHVLGVLLSQRGELDASEQRFREGLALFREAGDERRQAGSLNSLAAIARERGDGEAARALFEEAVALGRRLGDRKRLADPLSNLGVVALDAGDLERAQELFDESLAIDREHGNEWGLALNLGNLGVLALERGELDESRRLLADSLVRLRQLGDRWALLQALDRVAGLAAADGDPGLAARLAGAGAARRQELGEPLTVAERAVVERHLAPAATALGDEVFARVQAAGAALTLDEALDAAAAYLGPVEHG